jgi:hypothetical protein
MEGISMARQNGRTRRRNAASAAERSGQFRQTIQDSADPGPDSADAGPRQFAAMGEQAFAAWMRSSGETLQRVLAVNAELASWGREQLDDNIDAVRSLAQCRSAGDAYGVQVGLVRTSMEKSLRRANNVLNLAAHAMTAGTQPPRQPE